MRTVIIVTTLCALLTLPAMAGSGAGAIVQAFNTDAATEGMGGASASVWWNKTPDPWGNPALLGLHRGVSYHHSYSSLAVGLADDIDITSDRLTLGWGGFGLMLQGGPVDTYLNMGEQVSTNEQGEITERFESYEESEGLGLGVSMAGLVRQFRPENEGLNRLFRHVDLAGGMVYKSYEGKLAGDDVLQDRAGGTHDASMTDYGLLARASLYNSLDGPGLLPELDRALYPFLSGWRVTGAYGRSWLNWGSDTLTFEGSDQSDPLPREYRTSHSVRVDLGLPGLLVDLFPESLSDMLVEVFTPMVGFGMAWEERWPGYVWDAEDGEYVYEEDTSDDFLEEMDGWELTILGIYSQREGSFKADYGDVDGDTEGWGLTLDLGFFAARYDEATVPQATGLPSVDRESWTVMVDVLKLRDMLGE